jgi:copper(I)-binding protein
MRSPDRLAATLIAALAATPALAITQVPGPIEIGPSWGRADTADHTATLFTTLVNHGVLADRLTGGTCFGFGGVTLSGLDRTTQGDNQDAKGVLLAPGATATLGPDAAHLALSDADANTAQALADGDLVSCTLDFVHSGQRLVVFRIGAPEPATLEP